MENYISHNLNSEDFNSLSVDEQKFHLLQNITDIERHNQQLDKLMLPGIDIVNAKAENGNLIQDWKTRPKHLGEKDRDQESLLIPD